MSIVLSLLSQLLPITSPLYLVFEIIPHALELQIAFILGIYVVLLHGHEDILQVVNLFFMLVNNCLPTGDETLSLFGTQSSM